MPYADPARQREYRRQWIADRRAAWFAENGPCVQCGSAEQLELDHVDPGVKVTHLIWSWSKARRLAELAKCQVLCHDCHLQKTVEQSHAQWRGNTQEHSGTGGRGTTTGYRRGCRCVDCCQAQSEYHAGYRIRVRRAS